MKRDFVSFAPYGRDDLLEILELSRWLKKRGPTSFHPLEGKTAALIFEKPSLRTRVSFEVGILQLGGHPIFLTQHDIGVASRESVRDIAAVLSRYNDLIVARTMKHETLTGFADHATVPVINALTDLLHPCQIMADALTLLELGRLSADTKIVFIGDGNNVVNSWLELAAKVPLHFVLACPRGYEPDRTILTRAQEASVSRIEIMRDPFETARDADVLYTDVWVSMGQEGERSERQNAFRGYQINSDLLKVANRNCVVMHCLPAHRGEEVTDDVLEGERSIVLQQAENRLHVQKGIIAFLFGHHANRGVEAGMLSETTKE